MSRKDWTANGLDQGVTEPKNQLVFHQCYQSSFCDSSNPYSSPLSVPEMSTTTSSPLQHRSRAYNRVRDSDRGNTYDPSPVTKGSKRHEEPHLLRFTSSTSESPYSYASQSVSREFSPTSSRMSEHERPDSQSGEEEDIGWSGSEGDPDKTGSEKRGLEYLPEKRKMRRFRLTHAQTRYLMSEFAHQAHPDALHRDKLSRDIPGLSPRQVQVWFQNRRAKLKRLTADDQERMLRSRALPGNFNFSQPLQSSQVHRQSLIDPATLDVSRDMMGDDTRYILTSDRAYPTIAPSTGLPLLYTDLPRDGGPLNDSTNCPLMSPNNEGWHYTRFSPASLQSPETLMPQALNQPHALRPINRYNNLSTKNHIRWQGEKFRQPNRSGQNPAAICTSPPTEIAANYTSKSQGIKERSSTEVASSDEFSGGRTIALPSTYYGSTDEESLKFYNHRADANVPSHWSGYHAEDIGNCLWQSAAFEKAEHNGQTSPQSSMVNLHSSPSLFYTSDPSAVMNCDPPQGAKLFAGLSKQDRVVADKQSTYNHTANGQDGNYPGSQYCPGS